MGLQIIPPRRVAAPWLIRFLVAVLKSSTRTDSALRGAEITVTDIRLLLLGRQLILPGGGWLIMGRDEGENNTLARLAGEDDVLLLMEDWPGPTAVLRKFGSQSASASDVQAALNLAAALVVRFARKLPVGKTAGEVTCTFGGNRILICAAPLADDIFRNLGLL